MFTIMFIILCYVIWGSFEAKKHNPAPLVTPADYRKYFIDMWTWPKFYAGGDRI